jgi:hypothetical protein
VIIVLKRIYWVITKVKGKIIAKVGYRKHDNAPYEIYIEEWEVTPNGWVYKGTQSRERQEQLKKELKELESLRLKLLFW